eukprot:167128-Chlamydomonas_euryale.AAC.10
MANRRSCPTSPAPCIRFVEKPCLGHVAPFLPPFLPPFLSPFRLRLVVARAWASRAAAANAARARRAVLRVASFSGSPSGAAASPPLPPSCSWSGRPESSLCRRAATPAAQLKVRPRRCMRRGRARYRLRPNTHAALHTDGVTRDVTAGSMQCSAADRPPDGSLPDGSLLSQPCRGRVSNTAAYLMAAPLSKACSMRSETSIKEVGLAVATCILDPQDLMNRPSVRRAWISPNGPFAWRDALGQNSTEGKQHGTKQ